MALLVYLVVAVLVVAAARIMSIRRVRMRRYGVLDAEKGVVTMPGANDGGKEGSRHTTPLRSIRPLPAKLPRLYDDTQAANDQLLSEFAASTALDRPVHPDRSSPPTTKDSVEKSSSPASSEEERPVLVNPKQFHRILKRRAARQAMEESLRLMAQRMERGRELRSMRGFDGVVAGAVR